MSPSGHRFVCGGRRDVRKSFPLLLQTSGTTRLDTPEVSLNAAKGRAGSNSRRQLLRAQRVPHPGESARRRLVTQAAANARWWLGLAG